MYEKQEHYLPISHLFFPVFDVPLVLTACNPVHVESGLCKLLPYLIAHLERLHRNSRSVYDRFTDSACYPKLHG